MRTREFGVNTPSQDHDQLCWAHTWLTSHADITQVSVASIQPGESLRLKGESKDHVTSMVQAGDMPPIIVHRPTMKVIDGTHRVTAAKRQHRDTIAVRFFDGTVDEAFVLAVVANAGNGLPMTTKDRKAAAARILGIYPDWSDRMIADTTGLSHHTVGGIRRKRSGGQFAHLNRRLGRDGKTYPPRPTAGRRAGANLIRADQKASVREVTRQTGALVGNTQNVRSPLRQSVEPMVPTNRGAGLGFHLARAKEILRRLWNDPEVRSHDKGKAMMELLSHSLRTAMDAQAAIRSAPEHYGNAMAEYAAACGDSWHRLAKDLLAKAHTG